jgi:ethanolamine transporter EutH
MFKKEIKIPQQGIELILIGVLAIFVYIISSRLDILENIIEFSHKHENWELDELLIVAFFLVLALVIFIARRKREFQKAEKVLKHKNESLKIALSEIKQLKGIIPICSSCKKIRDDEGYWQQVEVYVKKHSDVDFSHGICPDCAEKLYPGYLKKDSTDPK